MKKSLFVLFTLILCLFCLVSCGDKAAECDKAVKAYCDFIGNEVYFDRYFALAYIDEDDIPELVITDGGSHPSRDYIYTYSDGTVTKIGEVGSFGCFKFAPRQNSTVTYDGGMGLFSATFQTIKNGAIETVKYYFDDSGNEGHITGTISYEIDGSEVSEEEYYAELKETESAHTYVSIGFCNGFVVGKCLKEFRDSWQNFLIEDRCTPAIAAYQDFMKEEDMQEWNFALCYIDEDDIPELIISEGDFHAAGAAIYTYMDGEVTEVGYVGSFGEFRFAPTSNSIISSYMGQGVLNETFYSIKEGALEEVKYFYDDSGNGGYITGTITFKIDGNEVTEEEYYAERETMEKIHTYITVGYDNGYAVGENIGGLKDNWQDFLIRR